MILRVLVGSAPRDDFSYLSLAQQLISSGCGAATLETLVSSRMGMPEKGAIHRARPPHASHE
jgi:hypothetical protein